MRTINTTFALLFAAIAFTACTNLAIEPMRPATQLQTITRPDTTSTPTRILMEGDEQSTKPNYGKVTPNQESDRNNDQPRPVADPMPRPMPKPVVKSQPKPDTLAY